MDKIGRAISHLMPSPKDLEQTSLINFREFLDFLAARPEIAIRNIFQVFSDMVTNYFGEGIEEYPDDPESVGFVRYDCDALFVEGSDHPFLADRLFANRLMKHVKAFRSGALQNKIYIFEGPPGCGKSTFLNNLLRRFQEYANTSEGSRFEVVWRLNRRLLSGALPSHFYLTLGELESADDDRPPAEGTISIPCPSHDNPILMIPKNYRRTFYNDLLPEGEFKDKLFSETQYQWVFRDQPCTVCSSIYTALLDVLKSPQKVFSALFARRFIFNRRLGQGVSVFNPGDKPMTTTVLENPKLQERIEDLLKDSNSVRYIYSNYAKTNGGIYALMDIKGHNTERLIDLHNIISEGVHRVENVEENVSSLFVALMNPEDKSNIKDIQSFADRIAYIKIPYILDLQTEVEIYRNTFGKHIDKAFLPRVLHNFARVIISTRLSPKSEGMLDWIEEPSAYQQYCDTNLLLLKMEIYTGHIPPWLSDDDLKRFTAGRRRRILGESESEGSGGLSGRDSLKIFNEFYSTYEHDKKLINMSMLKRHFTEIRSDFAESIPEGFIDSLVRMYDYGVLNEVKESLFYYNEDKVASDIKNYLFAINFEIGATVRSIFTGDEINVTEELLSLIEGRLLGPETTDEKRAEFRNAVQKIYASKTLTQDIGIDGLDISNTELFHDLEQRYVRNLKNKVLDPFLENDNFRRAIKNFDTVEFRTYDKRIRDDITYLMRNLMEHSGYTKTGAREMCIYVIDNDLAKTFTI